LERPQAPTATLIGTGHVTYATLSIQLSRSISCTGMATVIALFAKSLNVERRWIVGTKKCAEKWSKNEPMKKTIDLISLEHHKPLTKI
jgi:hypothetical protein